MLPKYWTKATSERIPIIAMKGLNIVHALKLTARVAYFQRRDVYKDPMFKALFNEYISRYKEDQFQIKKYVADITNKGILLDNHIFATLEYVASLERIADLKKQLKQERAKLKELRRKR